MFCPECGQPHEPVPVVEETTVIDNEPIATAEVEIARINANRDITLAKIARGIAESEAVQEAAIATAEADAVKDALAPPPPPEADPVVVVSDSQDDGGEIEPPPEADDAPSEPSEPHRKPRGLGMW
jgi:hypothetical protein